MEGGEAEAEEWLAQAHALRAKMDALRTALETNGDGEFGWGSLSMFGDNGAEDPDDDDDHDD